LPGLLDLPGAETTQIFDGDPMHCIAVFAIVAVLAASPARALNVKSPGADWTEAHRSSELVIFTKDVKEGRRIMAVSEIKAPAETVFNVLGDFEHYPDFMPYVKESRVLSRRGSSEVVTYARGAPPFVSERDYPLKVRMTPGIPKNGGVFRIDWAALPGAWPEIEGVVRVKLSEGSWLVEPLHRGKRTRLTYSLLTNAGGLIPGFVVNLSNTIAIPELFEAVKKRSMEKTAEK
jgi:uncharacterized membrane protein